MIETKQDLRAQFKAVEDVELICNDVVVTIEREDSNSKEAYLSTANGRRFCVNLGSGKMKEIYRQL